MSFLTTNPLRILTTSYILWVYFLIALPAVSMSNPDIETMIKTAQELEVLHQTGEAIKQYELAYQLNSSHPVILDRLSELYLEKEKYQQVVYLLQPTPSKTLRNPRLCRRLAKAYTALGNARLAEKAYRETLTLDSDDAQTMYDLALLMDVSGRTDEAVEFYRRVITHMPNHAAAYFQLGVIAYRAGSLEKARHYFQQATLFDPAAVSGYYNLGLVLLDLKRWEEARNAFQKAIHLQPDHAPAYYQTGVAYEEQGFLKEAIENYGRALQIDPRLELADAALNDVRQKFLHPDSEDLSTALKRKQLKDALAGTAERVFPTSSPYASTNAIHTAGAPMNLGANAQGLILQMGATLVEQWLSQAKQTQDDRYYRDN
ncbi:MAG: hypothetical protein COV74_03420 [Candidatus Omnitrophica bacterium CG11_big_fil_rev_8_21_14_0_20_45_26]|uniref:Uncharacterized protein n=1 Tax=Candidatus Abzuiibacterium crystallinum TaxID=1974748 RepID=A0A2H0LR24_9BACT|nr:MAG: hypothetical protein COV74_03420 [Candidatus Omnitrophica bacterium CG11_big_fil_rev_8_21_14_0_20_45_26]PIW64251.1 MAG: hypothetical protein COW12_07050 [Candidatus Omnitrophica bacterium CG12_big_fil_rev_8_21_14_0_65_45_16]